MKSSLLSLPRTMGLLAAVAGVAAAFAGSPYRSRIAPEVTALELAQWIKDRKPDLRVIDVRTQAAFDEYHIPTAELLPPASRMQASFLPGETVVIYTNDGAGAAPFQATLEALGFERVVILRGGLAAWSDDVMNLVIPTDVPVAARAEVERVAALSRYFGGVPRTAGSTADPSKSAKPRPRFGC